MMMVNNSEHITENITLLIDSHRIIQLGRWSIARVRKVPKWVISYTTYKYIYIYI